VRWDEGTRTLSIGAREGGYDGMPGKRAISVRFYAPGRAVAPDFAESAQSFVYDGTAITVRRP
jgi:alpha-D-xyloside xylohydrolase